MLQALYWKPQVIQHSFVTLLNLLHLKRLKGKTWNAISKSKNGAKEWRRTRTKLSNEDITMTEPHIFFLTNWVKIQKWYVYNLENSYNKTNIKQKYVWNLDYTEASLRILYDKEQNHWPHYDRFSIMFHRVIFIVVLHIIWEFYSNLNTVKVINARGSCASTQKPSR